MYKIYIDRFPCWKGNHNFSSFDKTDYKIRIHFFQPKKSYWKYISARRVAFLSNTVLKDTKIKKKISDQSQTQILVFKIPHKYICS